MHTQLNMCFEKLRSGGLRTAEHKIKLLKKTQILMAVSKAAQHLKLIYLLREARYTPYLLVTMVEKI